MKYPIEGKVINFNDNSAAIEILFVTKDCVTGNPGLRKEYYIPDKDRIFALALSIDLRNNENSNVMSTDYLTAFD